ncbi:MAG: STM3941 family protein [Ktedonobacteraceae bacterium]
MGIFIRSFDLYHLQNRYRYQLGGFQFAGLGCGIIAFTLGVIKFQKYMGIKPGTPIPQIPHGWLLTAGLIIAILLAIIIGSFFGSLINALYLALTGQLSLAAAFGATFIAKYPDEWFILKGRSKVAPGLPITLYPSRPGNLLLLSISLIFVTLGIWALHTDSSPKTTFYGYGVIVVFGFLALVFAGRLIPSASCLILTTTGFVVRNLYREHKYQWSDISGFRVARVATSGSAIGYLRVVWDYSATYKARSKSPIGGNEPGSFKKGRGFLSVSVPGGLDGGRRRYDAKMPDNYGKNPKELAVLLNGFRKQYSGASAGLGMNSGES